MNKNKILLIIFCITLPLFLILFSYKTVLFLTDLTPNQENTMNYLQNKEELNLNYTEEEYSHLLDVKSVMKYLDYLFYSLLLIITLIITYYQKNKEQLKKLFMYGGITTISSVLMILLFSLTSFNSVFTIFHKIFFPQGNWTFPLDSLLIQTFPLQFFISISKNIFLLSLVLGSFFILSILYLKYGDSKKS